MLLLDNDENTRIEGDVSILAEASVRAKNRVWLLTRQITLSAETKFFAVMCRFMERERNVMKQDTSSCLVHTKATDTSMVESYSMHSNTSNQSQSTYSTSHSPSSSTHSNDSSSSSRRNQSQRLAKRSQQPHQEAIQKHPIRHLPPFPPLDFSPTKNGKRPRSLSLEMYKNWHIPGVRPGMSVRVIRAERIPSLPTSAQYVIQVVDLHTKVFWVLKKRFRELYRLRKDIVRMIRTAPLSQYRQLKYLIELPFPRRSLKIASCETILRRRLVLENFLRNVASLDPSTTLHINILLKLQHELSSPDFIDSLEKIDTSDEPCEIKWLAFDLFRTINSCCTVEGLTCQRFLHAFRNRCAIVQATIYTSDSDQDNTILALNALQDLRDVTTQIQKYIYEHLDPMYRETIMQSGHYEDVVDEAIHECILVTVEDAVMVPLQEQIQYLMNLTIDMESEKKLTTKIQQLFGKSQTFFGIPDHLQNCENWGKACYHLSMMEERTLPSEKLKELVASAYGIFQACGDKGGFEWNENSALNADEYLPIHIYAVVHSGLKRPFLIKELLGATIHPNQMLGEIGYFLTMFEAALKYICDTMTCEED